MSLVVGRWTNGSGKTGDESPVAVRWWDDAMLAPAVEDAGEVEGVELAASAL